MEFTQEQIEEIGLSEEQVTKVISLASENETKIKTELEGLANTNAERIIDGAIKPVEELTGIKREKGEKAKDFLSKAAEGYVLSTKASLERKEKELDEKLKNNKGDEVLINELNETKEKLKELKQIAAEHDEWKKNDYKGKYEESNDKLNKMEKRIAFNSITPGKPEKVNKYEWDAKLKEWREDVMEKNNIVLDENDTPWAVDKENEFKKIKLEDLLKQHKEINELIAGGSPTGLGAKPATEQYDGVPFKISKEANPTERAKLIKEYLIGTENLDPISDDYAKRYTAINKAILEKNPAK